MHERTGLDGSDLVQSRGARRAFGELILGSGHLEKVLAQLDEGVTQSFFEVVS